MSQEVKIGVAADTGGAEQSVKRIEAAADRAAAAVQKIAQAGQAADRELGKLDQTSRRLEVTQRTLGREFGRPISEGDAARFLANFDRIREGRGVGSARVRSFNSFDDWYRGHAGMYSSDAAAARHRRVVMAVAMQGTDDASSNGYRPPPPPPPSSPAPSPGGGGSGGGGGLLGRVGSTAMGFVGGGLALAGIGSIMSMAGRAIDLAQREGLANDATKRRLGNLAVSYYDVQNATRGSADALRTDYAGAAAYGLDYVREAGNVGPGDVSGLGGVLANAGRFANAYGIDPSTTIGFMGGMRRLGVAGDETGQKKLAGFIADAIDRSGYAADADKIIQAVGSWASTAARASLSKPNVLGYASALSGLTQLGFSGLDPDKAASILTGADAALRRGGNAGEAGQNFLFNALYQPGMGPFAVQGLMQGGLFASTRSIFGSTNGKPNSPLSSLYRGTLSDETNIDRIRAQVRRYGLDAGATAASMASVFGGSLADNQALLMMSEPELKSRQEAVASGAAQTDPAVETQRSLNRMADALTNAGGPLISVLNPIRDAVVDLANHFMPNRAAAMPDRIFAGNEELHGNDALRRYYGEDWDKKAKTGGMLRRAMREQALAVGSGQTFRIDDYTKNIADPNLRAGIRASLVRQREWIGRLNDSDRALGITPGTGVRQAMKESGFDYHAQSGVGAMGLMQFMPKTVEGLTPEFIKRWGHSPDPWNADDSIRLRHLLMQENLKRARGDVSLALRYYNGGYDRSHWGSQNAHYADGIVSMPMPESAAARMAAAAPGALVHKVEGTVTIKDAQGQVRGTTILRQQGPPAASGTG